MKVNLTTWQAIEEVWNKVDAIQVHLGIPVESHGGFNETTLKKENEALRHLMKRTIQLLSEDPNRYAHLSHRDMANALNSEVYKAGITL